MLLTFFPLEDLDLQRSFYIKAYSVRGQCPNILGHILPYGLLGLSFKLGNVYVGSREEEAESLAQLIGWKV